MRKLHRNKKAGRASAKNKNTLGTINFAFITFIILVVVLLFTVSTVKQKQETRTHAQLTPGLHVQGNMIVNAQGQQVLLHGVNRSGTEFACVQGNGVFDGPADAASLQVIKTWNVNAIRVPLNEDCWLGINGATTGGSAYQTAIINWVNLIVQNGITPILDLHWSAPGSQLATGQQMMADADHSITFWSQVATAFKGNNNVIFELYNEPHDISWSCWKSGGSSCGSFPVAGMQQMLDAVRQTGATNIVLIGGLAWSNDLSGWIANKPTDPLNNIGATFHVYNFNTCNTVSCWDGAAAQVATQVPIVATEIGEGDCQSGFVTGLMNWLDQHNISYLGWTWNTWGCTSGPSLISDYNGTPTAYGAGFKAHLLSLSNTPTAPASTLVPSQGNPSATQPLQLTPTVTITPTFGAIGDCHASNTCPTTLPSVTQIPMTPILSPTLTPLSTVSPAISTAPSAAPSTAPVVTPPHGRGSHRNILQLLLSLLQLIIQLLTRLLGGK